MSTVAIVGIVITGLFILVSIAVATQTIEKNKKEKRRLHSGLTAKARNFEYMLNGFPDGFLSKDLQVLVCKCLLQVYEQLNQLEPGNKAFGKKLSQAKQKFEQVKNGANKDRRVALADAAQIKEVQKLLKLLFNFISKLREAKQLSGGESSAYARQIKQLMLQTSIDTLTQAKNQALSDKKPRLAIHHLKLIVDKLNKENTNGQYNNLINEHSSALDQLIQHTDQEEIAAAERRKASDKEWDEVNKADDSWKKKAIYD